MKVNKIAKIDYFNSGTSSRIFCANSSCKAGDFLDVSIMRRRLR